MRVTFGTMLERQYAGIIGLDAIQGFAWKILWVGFVVSLGNELYRGATGRSCNLILPVMRTLVAGVIVSNLTEIGRWLDELGNSLAGVIGTQDSVLESFRGAWKTTVNASSPWEFFKDLGTRMFIGVVSHILYWTMLIAQMWVLEFRYTFAFGMTLFGGLFAVPLGVYPHMRTMGPWLKQLIEISLWPVIFQFLAALGLSICKETITQMSKFDLVTFLKAAKDGTPASDGDLRLIVHFFLLSAGYVYAVFMTPRIAAKIMASPQVESMSTMMAAGLAGGAHFAAGLALMGPMGAIAGPTAAMVGALRQMGIGDATESFSGASSAGASAGPASGSASSAAEPSLNTRSYPQSQIDKGA